MPPATLAPPFTSDAAIRAALRANEDLAIDVFENAKVEYQDKSALESLSGKSRGGRLGRLTYEFRTADTLNRNRRVYPSAVCKAAMEVFQQKVADNIIFGNLDHPHEWDPAALEVRLSEACVKVVECTLVNDTDIRIVFDILDNEDGQRLTSILAVKGNPGTSQRAVAIWREPTDEERTKYLGPEAPDDAWFIVAEAMRLITYDIVSDTGFSDAKSARVTESRKHDSKPDPGVVFMDRQTLAAQHPQLLASILAEGRQAAESQLPAKIDEAIAQRKPQIVEDAVKPINEQLAAEKETSTKLKGVLESIKPLLVEHGIVNEKITDAEAARKIGTLEAKVTTLEAQLKAKDDEIAAQKTRLSTLESAQKIRANLEKISAKYADSPYHNTILEHVAKQRIEDEKAAMETAESIFNLINAVNPNGNKGGGKGGGSGDPVADSLAGLLKQNPANPGAAANGGGHGAGNESNALGQAVLGTRFSF